MTSDPGSPPVFALSTPIPPQVKTFWTPLQKIHLFNEFLSVHSKEFLDVQMWQRFVNEFYTADAVLNISLPCQTTDQIKTFSISFPLIPRFFHTWAESGLTSLVFMIERIKETFLPNNLLLLDSPKIRILSTLQNGQQLVEHSGTLRILFSPTSKIQFMELNLTKFEHFVNSNSDNLFTLPLQAGFDPSVHHFLEMLVLVQASFGHMGFELENQVPPPPQQHPINFNMIAPSIPPQQPHILPKQQHFPTLLPRPVAPQDSVKTTKQPPQTLKFEAYNPEQAM